MKGLIVFPLGILLGFLGVNYALNPVRLRKKQQKNSSR